LKLLPREYSAYTVFECPFFSFVRISIVSVAQSTLYQNHIRFI
jgi:hypothetical protein